MARDLLRRLRSWEGLLLLCLLVVLAYNISRVPNFLTMGNQINLFQLGIEKAIVILIMTFVIISGEIDLSVASMMGLSAAVTAAAFEAGVPLPIAIVLALLTRRHGTLPPPEWWDPSTAKAITFPEWRQLREYFLSVGYGELSFPQRLRCYFMLLPWMKKHFRRMMKDLLVAADQILYNMQASRSASKQVPAAVTASEE